MKFNFNNPWQLLILILFIVLSFFQISNRIGEEQIKVWDESSSARNAVEMMISENYLFATIDGKPDYYDVKPPLQLWIKVLAYKVFGINEFAVRFPSLLSFFLLILCLFYFSSIYLKNDAIGLLLIIFPALSSGFVFRHIAWHGDTEMLLILATTLYILYAYKFLNDYPNKKGKYIFALSFLIVAAYFIKSIAGIAPLAGVVVYALIMKRKIIFKDYVTYIPALVFIVVLVVYYSIVEFKANGYLASIYEHHILPVSSYPGTPKHPEFSFYLNYLFSFGFYPFMYWLPIAIVPLLLSKNPKLKQFLIYLLIVGTVFLIGQSSVLMKNEWYIAPIYPILWMILSISIYETYTIVKSELFKKGLYIKVITLLIALMAILTFGHNYGKVYKKNQARYHGYVYELERDGKFLNDVKKWNKFIKKITVLSNSNEWEARQLDFYIKKFKYLDNTEITITPKISDSLINNYVLTTKESFIKELDQQYNYELHYKEQHGYLLYVTGRKAKL